MSDNTRQRRQFDTPAEWIAQKMGYSRQGVYRLRVPGNRDTDPMLSQRRMDSVEKAFGWTRADQYVAISKGQWISEFERVVAEAYAKEQKGK